MEKNKKRYKVGIIGCGNIFQRHLQAVKENSQYFTLTSICDINENRLNLLSKELNVPGYKDYRDLLKKEKSNTNLMVIATPNSFHYQQAIDSLKSGRDVIIEKPIDFSAKKVQEIQKLAKKVKKNAYAILQVRYNPTIYLVKHAIDNNFLGKIRSVSLVQRWQRPEQYFESWRADINVGGRTLYEVGIHYLDIMQLLFGRPTVLSAKVFSNKHTYVSFEDTIFSIVKFPSGASGSIEVTIAAEPHNLECSISVMGSEGYLKIGGKALDQIETAHFASKSLSDKFNKMIKDSSNSLEPNSYGQYAGSCPNHPTLYNNIALGKGIKVSQAVNVVKLIEDIYYKTEE